MAHTFYTKRAGISSAAAFQVSGRPFITGPVLTGSDSNAGEQKYTFPSITKSFTVINRSVNEAYVHFDTRANGDVITYKHYVTLPNQDDSFTFDVKCKEVYCSMASTGSVTASIEIFADLTGISTDDMFVLSGSGINENPTV